MSLAIDNPYQNCDEMICPGNTPKGVEEDLPQEGMAFDHGVSKWLEREKKEDI